MHLSRYVGNVTSRRRHRICTTMAARRFRFAVAQTALSLSLFLLRKHARGRQAGLSDVLGLSDLNDLAVPYVPRNLSPPRRAARSGFRILSADHASSPARPVNFKWDLARREPARLRLRSPGSET